MVIKIRILLTLVILIGLIGCNNNNRNKQWHNVMKSMNISKNKAVFTTKNVVNKNMLITRVYHDNDDEWQFFDDISTNSNENIMIVSIEQIIGIDSTILDVINLQKGYFAKRSSLEKSWEIEKIIEENEK